MLLIVKLMQTLTQQNLWIDLEVQNNNPPPWVITANY